MRRDETGFDGIKQQQEKRASSPFILLLPVSSRLILFSILFQLSRPEPAWRPNSPEITFDAR